MALSTFCYRNVCRFENFIVVVVSRRHKLFFARFFIFFLALSYFCALICMRFYDNTDKNKHTRMYIHNFSTFTIFTYVCAIYTALSLGYLLSILSCRFGRDQIKNMHMVMTMRVLRRA